MAAPAQGQELTLEEGKVDGSGGEKTRCEVVWSQSIKSFLLSHFCGFLAQAVPLVTVQQQLSGALYWGVAETTPSQPQTPKVAQNCPVLGSPSVTTCQPDSRPQKGHGYPCFGDKETDLEKASDLLTATPPVTQAGLNPNLSSLPRTFLLLGSERGDRAS